MIATIGIFTAALIPALAVLAIGTWAARSPAALPAVTLLALAVYGASVGLLWWLI